MAITIRRIADSCLTVTNDAGTSLIDPGFWAWERDEIDLSRLGSVEQVLVTHEHGDHVHPEFVRWLVDRGQDVTVHANDAVAAVLLPHDIEVHATDPEGVTSEDVLHETTPMGDTPPNRAFTVTDALTHPGDSFQPRSTGPVLAVPFLTPFGSLTRALQFVRELRPRQVVPIHDFYLSASGREWVTGVATRLLAADDIEVIPLDWGDGYTL